MVDAPVHKKITYWHWSGLEESTSRVTLIDWQNIVWQCGYIDIENILNTQKDDTRHTMAYSLENAASKLARRMTSIKC